MNAKGLFIISVICLAVFLFYASCGNKPKQPNEGWNAPPEANYLKNPLFINPSTEQKGRELYQLYCRSCHGETGLGDGAAGREGNGPKPANFHNEKLQRQSDGALFWKLNTGRDNMPSFKQALTEEQRWQLISFIRILPGQSSKKSAPVA